MVLPVSCSLLIQLFPAMCLDYVPGVSSSVYLESVLPHVFYRLLNIMSMSSCVPLLESLMFVELKELIFEVSPRLLVPYP